MKYLLLICGYVVMLGWSGVAAQTAPYVNAATIAAEFDGITAANMDTIRARKIFMASRSYGLNLYNGLVSLAGGNPQYSIVQSYARYDVFGAGGSLMAIPPDAFTSHAFVHFLATASPAMARVNELAAVLRHGPHWFRDAANLALVAPSTDFAPSTYAPYRNLMDSLRAEFPWITFIYVTGGPMDTMFPVENAAAAACGVIARRELKGVVPLYDIGFVLTNDSACGDHYCPGYCTDPAGIHPNTIIAQELMAKGFLLMLKKIFCDNQPVCGSPDPPSVPAGLTGQGTSLHSVRLTWPAATHAACGVRYYLVRRNGADIGIAYGPGFSDHGLTEGASYSYQVAAMSQAGVVSAFSTALHVRVLNDSLPPQIVSVPTSLRDDEVQVIYNEDVDSAAGLDPANYAISNGVTVQTARYYNADSIVMLTTTPLPANQTCTLTVNNVVDRSRNRNVIATVSRTFHYSSMDLEADVEGYWPCDDTLRDFSGHNHHGTWTGTLSYGPGKCNRALALDGTAAGSHVRIPDGPGLDSMARLTIAVWARKDSAAVGGDLVRKHTSYNVNISAAAVGGYLFNTGSIRANISTTNAGINDTAWHHYCLVYDGAGLRTYVDGVLRGTTAQSGNVASNSNIVYIGKDPWGNCFKGDIDELRLYAWALDSTQVMALKNRGLGNADSLAVRALLDANGSSRTVDGVSVFNAERRITELYLQTDLGGDITRITSHIGQLTELQLLNAYGPASHNHATAHLSTIDPAISNCRKLKQLLLNDNDLTALPAAITALDSLTTFSAGNNQLCGITGSLSTWLTQNDPDWASSQFCTGVKPDRTAVTGPAPYSIRQSTGHITIARGTWTGALDADIYTTRGKLVYSIQQCPENQMVWRTESAAAGIYFVRVTNGQTTAVQKLVIVR